MMRRRFARLTLLACASMASLGLIAGASPAAAKTKTKTKTACASGAVPIPDSPQDATTQPFASVSLAVPVSVPKFKGKPQDGVVTALNSAGVRITHTFDSDLLLQLVSPGGKVAVLAGFRDQATTGGDGYGSGAASCAGGLVSFGDAFPTSILTPGNTGANTPITGSFKPEQSVGTFAGGPARGNWTLIATDEGFNDVGTLNALSVNLTYRYKVLNKKKK